MSNIKDLIKKGLLAMAAVIVGVALLFALAGSYRVYSVWSASKQGQADLALAENSRKVLVEQAKAVRQIIYIPTEAGLPILEAGKRLQDGGKKK